MCFRKGALKGVSSQPFFRKKQDYTTIYRATHLCAIASKSTALSTINIFIVAVAVVAVVAVAVVAVAVAVEAVVVAWLSSCWSSSSCTVAV